MQNWFLQELNVYLQDSWLSKMHVLPDLLGQHFIRVYTVTIFRERNTIFIGIKCYPCPSVRPYFTYLRRYLFPDDVPSLNQILLIRILWKFVTLFSTMMSSSSWIMVYMAPCFKELLPLIYKKSSWNDVCSLTWKVLIIILWNLVTLLSTIMCSSFRMAHIASCLQELLPFVNDNSLFIRIWQ